MSRKNGRRRRVFLWVFLLVQVLFIIWIIAAGVATDHSVTHCSAQYLTQSQCKSAAATGSAIGIGLVIVFWAIVDIILGISYGVYRLSTRHARPVG